MECPDQYSDCLSGRCLCHFGFDQEEKKCVVTETCVDWLAKGAKSGVYTVQLAFYGARSVWCDMDTAGGGWLVIQRRRDFTVDFNRSWTEYASGFGNLSGDFWLGIDAIGELASYDTRLRVELVDWTGTQYWAEYSHFSLGSPQGDYQLYASGYSGTA
ncbi:angiopoietin-related protein 7-like, partial [Pomacea canaliculata]|uniref:angiopoietin-related protein 7-like n=1 Tax=Pomacea canaliculata TaxID=400727 RepID=UPI000D73AD8D